jgi:hypothetical protein
LRYYRFDQQGCPISDGFLERTFLVGVQRTKAWLEAADPSGKLELIVVDIDGCPDLYMLPEFDGRLHGAGEAAWILGGKTLFVSRSGDRLEECTRRLLQNEDTA